MNDSFDELLRWCREHGAVIAESLRIVSTPNEGYVLVSTSDIPAREPVFQIPHSICITPTVATTAIPTLDALPATAQIAAFLAVEKHKKGPWAAYLDTLPREISTPLCFSPEEVDVLRGTNLYYSLPERIQLHRKEYKQITRILQVEW
jgi:hypothetical protein